MARFPVVQRAERDWRLAVLPAGAAGGRPASQPVLPPPHPGLPGRVGKNPVFFFTQPSGFWFFVVYLGFLGFFWAFLDYFRFSFIFAQKREFLGFFSLKNTLRCIQTLNYNHSY